MSAYTRWFIRAAIAPPLWRLLANTLEGLADARGYSQASLTDLAAITGEPRHQVLAALRAMERRGFLEIFRSAEIGKPGHANVYHLRSQGFQFEPCHPSFTAWFVELSERVERKRGGRP